MWKQSSKKTNSEKKFTSAQQAYDCALNLLSYRDYSDSGMLDRLQRKGADEEQARESVEKLKEYGLLDEKRYACRIYEMWLNKRCYGRQHLQAELARRGIRKEYIGMVLDMFTPEMEAERAEAAAEIFMQRNRKKLEAGADRKLAAAAGRFMAARGFSSRYMYILLSRLHYNNDI